MKYTLFIIALLTISQLSAQQISIPRIESMKNMPSPYVMRDWKQVAIGFDSLLYNINSTDQYKPLTSLYYNTVNYPEHGSFYQPTYIGSLYPTQNEAISSLPGIVGATLCGVDKQNQYGQNWVLLTEEFFNKSNNLNLYNDNVGQGTGYDWWYEIMPNVYFYQINDLYPQVGHFATQFQIVADRYLQCISSLGASTTPWTYPNMNHRAFNFATMQPYDQSVPEGDSSGALAWLLYNAYVKMGNEKYRIGAMQCMEEFQSFTINPSYELLYFYGTMVASRMNAELGTNYDLNKMLNWCMEPSIIKAYSQSIGWGTTVGTWNGIDASGLSAAIAKTGDITYGDYAFVMNTFQMAGTLAPIARYNDSYARILGKLLLNTANSCRLFYSNYLPKANQDHYDFQKLNDPKSYVAYESVRQYKGSLSPYATGDAFKSTRNTSNWANTNLSIYSSTSVGYLGGILDTTNVQSILRFDLLKTDFYHNKAYPTYLYYNPYAITKSVNLDLGANNCLIYDEVSNSVLTNSATGIYSLSIPANSAIVIVLAPANGTISYDHNKTLINNIVVDYVNSSNSDKFTPIIKSLSATKTTTLYGENINLYCTAEDKQNSMLTYKWTLNGTTLPSTTSQLSWTAPNATGLNNIICTVTNTYNLISVDTVTIKVVSKINTSPVITNISSSNVKLAFSNFATLTCTATDADNDVLKYTWKDSSGNTLSTTSLFQWKAPTVAGFYNLSCFVDDQNESVVSNSIQILVYEPTLPPNGNLVAYYPLDGNILDLSGKNNNGVDSKNLVPAVDELNSPYKAFSFDGLTSYIRVANSTSLNFSNAVTVSIWLKQSIIQQTEQYPLSYNLWNRFKISTVSNAIKWTVKSADGLNDVVTKTAVNANQWVHVVGTYDGVTSNIYLNGNLETSVNQTGAIATSNVDLLIGRANITADGYNFSGSLNDIRIYDFALSLDQIQNLYNHKSTSIVSVNQGVNNNSISLFNYRGILHVNLDTSNPKQSVTLNIWNLQGCKEMIFNDIIKGQVGPQKIELDISLLKPGIYICNLNIDNENYFYKILKE